MEYSFAWAWYAGIGVTNALAFFSQTDDDHPMWLRVAVSALSGLLWPFTILLALLMRLYE